MKATDKITLEVTGHQLAKAYAILGNANGLSEPCLFRTIQRLIDPNQLKYDELILDMSEKECLNYSAYKEKWEDMLFSKPKSVEEIELDSVLDRIAELTQQAETLKKLIDKE